MQCFEAIQWIVRLSFCHSASSCKTKQVAPNQSQYTANLGLESWLSILMGSAYRIILPLAKFRSSAVWSIAPGPMLQVAGIHSGAEMCTFCSPHSRLKYSSPQPRKNSSHSPPLNSFSLRIVVHHTIHFHSAGFFLQTTYPTGQCGLHKSLSGSYYVLSPSAGWGWKSISYLDLTVQ